MKKYTIISTFPESGSQNIGDRLITSSLIGLIQDHQNKIKFNVIWRAENWENVKHIITKSDHIFFACLAIRPNMTVLEYPFLNNILETKIPFSVISAGTALNLNNSNIFSGFSEETLKALSTINKTAKVFSTRGYLTQEFCTKHSLNNAFFSGDVAFYDTRFSHLKFQKDQAINNIGISSPHYSKAYIYNLQLLHNELKDIFPKANIYVIHHGKDEITKKFCKENRIIQYEIYNDPESGLELYSETDLHVGFRVHGHVSALKRRKYSYLLEQDGRGCDYGLTINNKISVPNYIRNKSKSNFVSKITSKLYNRNTTEQWTPEISPVHEIISLIRQDARNGFDKFCGLEIQLQNFADLLKKAIQIALK